MDGQITLAYTTSRPPGKTPAALPPVNRQTDYICSYHIKTYGPPPAALPLLTDGQITLLFVTTDT